MRVFQTRYVKPASVALAVMALLDADAAVRVEIDDDRHSGRHILLIVHAPDPGALAGTPNPKQWKETT